MTPEELQQTAGLPVTENPLSALAKKYLNKIGSAAGGAVDRAASAMPDVYAVPGAPTAAVERVTEASRPMIGPPEPPISDAPNPPPTPPVYGQGPVVVPMRNAGAVVRPAGWQPGTHAVALQRGMGLEELEPAQRLHEAAAGHRLGAADQRLEAAQMQGMADGIYSASRAQAEQRAAEQMQALNHRREQYVAKEQQKLQRMAEETQGKVDPDALWKEKGEAARVGAAIMMAIGQFAAQWRGKGTNGALQVVNGAIDRSIDAQKANLASKRAAYDIRQNLYAQNLATFGDQERAILATKIQYLNGVESMAGQYLAQAKNKDAEAAHGELVAAITDERARHASDFAKLSHTQMTEQMHAAYKPAQMVGGASPVGQKGMADLYVPSLGGYARTKEEAQKMRDHDFRTRTINATLDRAKDILTEAKTLRPTSVENIKKLRKLQSELDSLSNEAAVKQTVKEGQGAMSKGDKDVSDATLGILGTKVWDPKMYVVPGGVAIQQAENEKALGVIAATQERALSAHEILGETVQPGQEALVETPHGYENRALLTPTRRPLTTRPTSLDHAIKKPIGRTK